MDGPLDRSPASWTEIRNYPIATLDAEVAGQWRSSIAVWATIIRLPIAIGIIMCGGSGYSVLAFGLVWIFVAIDILDGVIARSLRAENAYRRILDGLVDKLSVVTVLIFLATSSFEALFIGALIILRECIHFWIGSCHVARTGAIAVGAKWHQFYTLGIAVWGSALILSGGPILILSLVLAVLLVATTIDYAVQVDRSTRIFTSRLTGGNNV